MAWVGSTVTAQVVALLSAPKGLNACVSTLAQAEDVTLPPVGEKQILAQNVAIEVRVSQDRLVGIENQLQTYVDAVTQVLDQNRGDWGEGMFYAGCYEAALGPVKHGGRNFIQAGKVTFEVGVSD